MDYNILSNLEYCRDFVTPILTLISYSHALPAAITLLIGFFVYIQNRKLLIADILFSLSITFSLWVLADFLIWTNYDHASFIMAAWAPLEIFDTLLFVLTFYFIYVFIKERDVPMAWKGLAALALSPVLLLVPAGLSVSGYDLQECIAIDNTFYQNYVTALKLFIAGAAVVLIAYSFVKEKAKRSQIVLLGVGISIFLYSRVISSYISSQTVDYRYELYGLFGIAAFVGILAYLIVKYQAFNIKLIAAQALVVTLVVLIGAQFSFVRNPVNLVLTGITFTLVTLFGYFLIKSVQREVRQREQIEQLSNEKSEFMSFASHEIRNPITAMRGLASLIYDGTAGEVSKEVKQSAEKIMVTGNEVLALIAEFLDKSKIELGQIAYHNEVFDAGEVLKTLAEGFRPSAELKGLSIKAHITGGELRINADKAKVGEVVGNIIDNSIKYTATGSVTLSVEKKGGAVRISVSDTGAGISKEVIGKLFKKFSRADAAKANLKGTGLGLFLAKNFVEGMGGRIWVESEGEGKGSQFHIEFPSA